jgi:hypothetical protein
MRLSSDRPGIKPPEPVNLFLALSHTLSQIQILSSLNKAYVACMQLKASFFSTSFGIKIVRIHPKTGGCAQLLPNGTYHCKFHGKHGFRLPYFVAQDVLIMLGEPRNSNKAAFMKPFDSRYS